MRTLWIDGRPYETEVEGPADDGATVLAYFAEYALKTTTRPVPRRISKAMRRLAEAADLHAACWDDILFERDIYTDWPIDDAKSRFCDEVMAPLLVYAEEEWADLLEIPEADVGCSRELWWCPFYNTAPFINVTQEGVYRDAADESISFLNPERLPKARMRLFRRGLRLLLKPLRPWKRLLKRHQQLLDAALSNTLTKMEGN